MPVSSSSSRSAQASGLSPRVEPAGGHLPDVLVGGVAELADQEHARGSAPAGRIEERHDRRGSRMTEHLQLADRAVGKADGVEVEIDDAAGVEALG